MKNEGNVEAFKQCLFWGIVESQLIAFLPYKKQKRGEHTRRVAPYCYYSFTFYFNRRFDSLSSISTVIFGRSNLGENPHSALAQESSI